MAPVRHDLRPDYRPNPRSAITLERLTSDEAQAIWQRLQGLAAREQRATALDLLDVRDRVAARRRYRELAVLFHPDRQPFRTDHWNLLSALWDAVREAREDDGGDDDMHLQTLGRYTWDQHRRKHGARFPDDACARANYAFMRDVFSHTYGVRRPRGR